MIEPLTIGGGGYVNPIISNPKHPSFYKRKKEGERKRVTTLGFAISISGLETNIIMVASLVRSNSIHLGGEKLMNERIGHHDTH